MHQQVFVVFKTIRSIGSGKIVFSRLIECECKLGIQVDFIVENKTYRIVRVTCQTPIVLSKEPLVVINHSLSANTNTQFVIEMGLYIRLKQVNRENSSRTCCNA